MFTGLIETVGAVSEYTEGSDGGLTIKVSNCGLILGDVHKGDSISTNGVCLTVTDFDKEAAFFTVGVAPETIRRSNFGDLRVGSPVNLERAVSSETRLGGHVVQGHVDTIATVVKKEADGNAIAYTFELRDGECINYIVQKGFIAIDGTSLTITGVNYQKNQFSIMLIDYSQSKVILTSKELGDTVNIEVDLTGKLIAQHLDIYLQRIDENSPITSLITKLVEDELKKHLK